MQVLIAMFVIPYAIKSAGVHDGGGFPHVHVHAVTIYVQEECLN